MFGIKQTTFSPMAAVAACFTSLILITSTLAVFAAQTVVVA